MVVRIRSKYLTEFWAPLLLAVGFIFITTFQMVKAISEEDKIDILNNILVAEKVVQTDTFRRCLKTIERMMGPRNEDGSVDLEGIYSRFTQAYHYNFPATPYWIEAQEFLEESRKTFIRTRDLQKDWQDLIEYPKTCQDVVVEAEQRQAASVGGKPTESDKKLDKSVTECRDNPLISEVRKVNFENRLFTVCYRSVVEVVDAFTYSIVRRWYNGREPRFSWSLFRNMYNETTNWDIDISKRLNTDFPEYIAKIRDEGSTQEADELEERLNEIKARLSNASLPYPQIYFEGDDENLKELRYFENNDPQLATLLNFQNAVDQLLDDKTIFADGKPYLDEILDYDDVNHHSGSWKKSVEYFKKDFNDGSFNKFVEKVEEIYTNFLYVEQLPEGQRESINEDGIVVGDGLWDWNLKNGIHNMRVSWDLMGGILEEIKCYMKDTYYFHKREEAVQRTQVDLSTATLYSRISQSMQFPCRIENESDIVSPYCEPKNHEICAPMGPLDARQRTNSEHYGGKTLLKPKWIFQYDEQRKRCRGRKDYIMQFYACRCGFRLDCGKDLGVNITCQLQYNDLLRGQCRGSVGYPCKTLPLAPDRHHETCRSGYCDMTKNSCEDAPHWYNLHTKEGSRGHSSTRVKFIIRFLTFFVEVITLNWFLDLFYTYS